MNLPIFTESEACKSRRFCKPCLTDAEWRASVSVRYAMPNGCPHGVTAQTAVQRIAHGVVGLAKVLTNVNRASDATIAAREATCGGCEHLDRSLLGIRRCDKCGCAVAAKIRLKAERCPVGKWEAEREALQLESEATPAEGATSEDHSSGEGLDRSALHGDG